LLLLEGIVEVELFFDVGDFLEGTLLGGSGGGVRCGATLGFGTDLAYSKA